MIRFCDKKVYSIVEGTMSRSELFSFFLNKEHLTDVILVYSKDTSQFLGIITYDTLLRSRNDSVTNSYINTSKICASKNTQESFWAEANAYFKKYPKELLTVVNETDDILGFAYYEDDAYYGLIPSSLTEAEKCGLPILHTSKYQDIKMLVITDFNELAWRCYHLFKKEGLLLCVIGEKWEWFGFKSHEKYMDYADFQKLYIYAEGTVFKREEKRLCTFKFQNISQNFSIIIDLLNDSVIHLYADEIKKLAEKGATICEVQIPSFESIQYATHLELLGKLHNIDYVYSYSLSNKNMLPTDFRRSLLTEVYGTDIINTLVSCDLKPLHLNLAQPYKINNFIFKSLSPNNLCSKKIYLIGPCIVHGQGCLYKDTLPFHIQSLINTHPNYTIIAIPIAISAYSNYNNILKNLPICEDDIILVIQNSEFFQKNNYNCTRLDMKDIYNNPNRDTLFTDKPIHSNAQGNKILAQEIYNNYLKEQMEISSKKSHKFIQMGNVLSDEEIEQVTNYVETIKQETTGSVGAIVMNCNPFTYGHQYLIEYAASQVDWLYIFIVEENRSFFLFEDRFNMVKQGTSHLNNVIVVPSGKFVLSYETMPIYFEKSEKQDAQVDARIDLEIFARHIAPPLHITKRFVGEEPTDKITRQYNEQMLEIFEPFELALEIIPRKELNGQAISASHVRRYMTDEKWDELKSLVPETTYEVCLRYKDTALAD